MPTQPAKPTGPTGLTIRGRQKADRRQRLLRAAAALFAERGFHGVSIEDLGSAAGISGPAVYRHFPNKEAVLETLLVEVSERLLGGGREQVAAASDDSDALRRLVAFHTEFALTQPELISVQGRDLASLGTAATRRVRRLQREYVEVWVGVLTRLDPSLSPAEARTRAHAVFGLLNSTPFSVRATGPSAPGAAARSTLERMAVRALVSSHDSTLDTADEPA
jgi:AcrR family transcriptional regulator